MLFRSTRGASILWYLMLQIRRGPPPRVLGTRRRAQTCLRLKRTRNAVRGCQLPSKRLTGAHVQPRPVSAVQLNEFISCYMLAFTRQAAFHRNELHPELQTYAHRSHPTVHPSLVMNPGLERRTVSSTRWLALLAGVPSPRPSRQRRMKKIASVIFLGDVDAG